MKEKKSEADGVRDVLGWVDGKHSSVNRADSCCFKLPSMVHKRIRS